MRAAAEVQQTELGAARCVAAFFDVDLTILRVNSGTSWMQWRRRRGEISRTQMARATLWGVLYKLAILDMDTLARRLVADIAGDSVDDMLAATETWWREELRSTVAVRARRVVAEHHARGETVVLLTGGTQFVAERVAKELEIDHVLCSRLETSQGYFTGRLVEPPCFGGGKIHWAERWAERHDVDLGRSAFYTDSYSDLPMLERVGRPIAVNPDPRLTREARRRGWPIENWLGQ